MQNVMNRWAIYIDIEGFSSIFTTNSTRAISLLGTLMKYIHLIGCNIYPKSPERLFAHQFGDGFLIVSDFPEEGVVLNEENERFIELNWVVSTPSLLGRLFSGCGIEPPSHDDLKKKLTDYSTLMGNEFKEWKENASKLTI